MTRASRTKELLPFVLVIAGPLALLGPIMVRGEVLFWGTPLLQFAPWRTAAFDMLRQGLLPLWNPYLGMGAPLLASYQLALLYPPNLLLVVMGIAWGQTLLVVLHLMLAGCGMVLLARRLRWSCLAQSVAGLAFSLSGYLVARSGFLSINAAAAWLPWIVLCVDRLVVGVVEGQRSKRLALAASALALAFAMQWLAGHAQTAWYSLVLALSWGIWRALSEGGWRGLVRSALWLAGAGVMGFALAAAQLLPTLEYLANSFRASSLDTEFALTYSFWPWRALGVLLPDLFGNPAMGNYWGYASYWEDAIYLGVLPFLLALAAIVRSLRKRGQDWKLGRFLGLACLVAFLLALGKNTPLFPWLFNHVPTFGLFQAPARWNLILVFGLALLAGMGAEAWQVPTEKGRYWTRLGTAGAAMLVLTALGSALVLTGKYATFSRAFALAGAWLLIAGLMNLRRPSRFTLAWQGLVGAIVLIDLVSAGQGLTPSAQAEVYAGSSLLAQEVGAEHRLYMPPDIEYELKFERSHRFDTFEPEIDWRQVRDWGLPNTSLLDGLTSANNFDPILPDRYVTWMGQLDAASPATQHKMLRLMDVGWVAEPEGQGGVRYQPVEGASRLRFVGQALWVDSAEEALAHMTDADFDPSQVVVLEGKRSAELDAGGVAELHLVRTSDPGRVTVEVLGSEGGWLVLSDLWYPGWQAYVDGRQTDLLQADYAFRAVWVPLGDHLVTFRYLPISFMIGISVSIVAWLALAGMVRRWRRD
ncbi:MAG: YfhO family protein [Anaerolineales bacterium]|jgi:hypothetical protein